MQFQILILEDYYYFLFVVHNWYWIPSPCYVFKPLFFCVCRHLLLNSSFPQLCNLQFHIRCQQTVSQGFWQKKVFCSIPYLSCYQWRSNTFWGHQKRSSHSGGHWESTSTLSWRAPLHVICPLPWMCWWPEEHSWPCTTMSTDEWTQSIPSILLLWQTNGCG